GIVAAPGLPENLAYQLENELPETLSKYINSDVEWKISLTIDPLTGSAESVERIYEKTNDYNHSNEWAYTICITRSEEHTSELQSRFDLVCRLLLEKKKKKIKYIVI